MSCPVKQPCSCTDFVKTENVHINSLRMSVPAIMPSSLRPENLPKSIKDQI